MNEKSMYLKLRSVLFDFMTTGFAAYRSIPLSLASTTGASRLWLAEQP